MKNLKNNNEFLKSNNTSIVHETIHKSHRENPFPNTNSIFRFKKPPLYSKTFKGKQGEIITQKCLMLIKATNEFALKFSAYQEIHNNEKETINGKIELGNVAIDIYTLVVEDFCEALASYKRLYLFRNTDENSLVNKEDSINGRPSTNKFPSLKKNYTKQNRLTLENCYLKYLDGILLNSNVDLKIISGEISWNIYDSRKSLATIQDKPFSIINIPATNILLLKKDETMSMSGFGFSFNTTKPAIFTKLFGNVYLYII